MHVALAKDSLTVKNLLKNWPSESFSLVNTLSDHHYQCFSHIDRYTYALKLFTFFIELILEGDQFTLKILDIRGVVIQMKDIDRENKLKYSRIPRFFDLLNEAQEVDCNPLRQIFLDIQINEDITLNPNYKKTITCLK
jgi:hypothetical protein